MQKEKVDIDFLYNKWLRSISEERYLKNSRETNIAGLFNCLLKYGIAYDDAVSLKRRVMKDLITEDGMKNTNKKGHPHYKWLQNIDDDFEKIITDYYDPNSGLEIKKKVVYSRSKFMLPEDPEIIQWVKEKYGDNPDLIEQAHSVNNAICLEYFSELERKVLNG